MKKQATNKTVNKVLDMAYDTLPVELYTILVIACAAFMMRSAFKEKGSK